MSMISWSPLVKSVVDSALAISDSPENLWDEARDRMVLELIEEWLSKPFVWEVEVQDKGYDVSSIAVQTNVKPDLDNLETLGDWLGLATGTTRPTFMSGSGLSAETWLDRINNEYESFVDDFSAEILGDDLKEDDYETLPEVRIALEEHEATSLGDVDIEVEGYYQPGCGYLGKLCSMSPVEFAEGVSITVLEGFPFFKELVCKRKLESLPQVAEKLRGFENSLRKL